MTAKTALILAHEGVEEMEFVAPVDILRRAGVEVTVASAGPRLSVTGRSMIQIKADTLLTDALYSPLAVWDVLVIPGGPGVTALRSHPLVAEAVRRHRGRLIGAICAAPLVLLDAGLIGPQTPATPYSAHPATHGELPAASATQAVVYAEVNATAANASGQTAGQCPDAPTRLVTSRGAGTATAFALALVEHLYQSGQGKQLAEQVAQSICLQSPQ